MMGGVFVLHTANVVRRHRARPLVILVLIGAAAAASAQNAALDATKGSARLAQESGNSGQLEEIVVTAQKRSENLQQVPVSAVVINGQAMMQQNINSLGALSETVPSVHISFHPRSGDLYIRGIGSGENQDFEQSVGTFIDDIYHGRSRTSAATFLDLDRVEILKGPQSTFFGDNAIAGALNIVTRKPSTDKANGFVRALYGQYGQYAVEGAANAPLTETFAVRVA